MASLIASTSAASCLLMNHSSNCNYVIKCDTTAGSVQNPVCDGEPYVTFIITNATQPYLTPAFFASTNFDSRVREIKGIDNSWTNIDTSAFRYYTKCLRVDLNNNKIKQINAEAFRNMINMRYLNLSGNSIKSFYSKSFWISDSRNSHLQELDLSHNVLQYLGSELNEVSNLKTLYLQYNKLSTIADDAFMNLKDLNKIYLQHNLLTSINLTFIHLKSLTILDLSYNNLIKLSGYEMNRVIGIVEFNVSHNQLTSVEANCFNQASNLQKADFSFNYIKITLETIMFFHNNKLNYLNFYNNRISGLQDNAFQHCNLNYLNLENNNISGDINQNSFSNLRMIDKLDLSQQSITGIRNNAFIDMESLTYLNLSRNNIRVVETNSFVNTSITVLDLSYNNISMLNFLNNALPNLTELFLNNNNITDIPKHAFNNQTSLIKLDLSMNKIILIEEYSLPLNKLQYLNIAGSCINGSLKRNIFSPAKYLRFLDLSYFNITKIDSLAFIDMPVMAKLNLSNNHIEYIEDNNFAGVPNLYSLDISHNEITGFKLNISTLTNLKALYFKNNKLTNISGLFSSLFNLSYLDLSHNNIQNVSEKDSHNFPNLTVLYLDHNNITSFNNPTANRLTTLIDLSLSGNNISNINLSYYQELMAIDLSNNRLTHIKRSFLEKNEFLQALDVSRNEIADIPPGTFRFMKNLKLLNLSSNHLTRLRYGSLKGLHKTEILDLSKNKIAQLDVDIFHECDDLKTLIIDYNNIKTFDVERLILMSVKKLRTLSLGGNPILCKEIVHNIKSANTTFYAIRQVEITSIDKIYHEDNVHGIKCGDYDYLDPTLITTKNPDLSASGSMLKGDRVSVAHSTVVLIWCSVLTVILIAGGVAAYIKLYKKRVLIIDRNVTMQLRSSLDLTGSEFQSDLLG